MSVPFYVAPEQLVRDKAEFARKGIARGRSIIAIEFDGGILLLAENISRALQKISEVYDRIAFAGVGRYNEFETLRKAGIRQADLMGYLYSRADVTAMALATAFSQTLGQIFSHEPKPFEVEVLICEVGSDPDGNRLYKVTYDGTLYDQRGVVAIGGKGEALLSPPNLAMRLVLAEGRIWARHSFENDPALEPVSPSIAAYGPRSG